jgi:hypothetical protein
MPPGCRLPKVAHDQRGTRPGRSGDDPGAVIEELGVRREDPAYRSGWEDGRFGPTRLFLENPNLAGWAGPRKGWRTTGATAKGGGCARCWRTGDSA